MKRGRECNGRKRKRREVIDYGREREIGKTEVEKKSDRLWLRRIRKTKVRDKE